MISSYFSASLYIHHSRMHTQHSRYRTCSARSSTRHLSLSLQPICLLCSIVLPAKSARNRTPCAGSAPCCAWAKHCCTEPSTCNSSCSISRNRYAEVVILRDMLQELLQVEGSVQQCFAH